MTNYRAPNNGNLQTLNDDMKLTIAILQKIALNSEIVNGEKHNAIHTQKTEQKEREAEEN